MIRDDARKNSGVQFSIIFNPPLSSLRDGGATSLKGDNNNNNTGPDSSFPPLYICVTFLLFLVLLSSDYCHQLNSI